SWVAATEPGLLDYEADAMRTARRYTKVLTRMARRTAWLGLRTRFYTKVTEVLGPHITARARQRLANRMASGINENAAYTEKRVELLQKLVDDLDRNYRGIITNQSLDTPEEIAQAKQFRATLDGNRQISGEAADSTLGYQQTLGQTAELNLSRSLTIAS